MINSAAFRALEDLHNELAHIREFPFHYSSHMERLSRRVAVVSQIQKLLGELVSC